MEHYRVIRMSFIIIMYQVLKSIKHQIKEIYTFFSISLFNFSFFYAKQYVLDKETTVPKFKHY